jgi:hypothetical protein
MAEFLFSFFEGAHDANFFARVLVESGEYVMLKRKVAAYPKNISKFLQGLYQGSNPDDVVVGKPLERMTPVLVLKSTEHERYIFGFVTGGCDKTEGAAEVLQRIKSFAIPESEDQVKILGNIKYSILFVFDADSRGVDDTKKSFASSYGSVLKDFGDIESIGHNSWINLGNVKLGLYIFCDGSGIGTLEDNVLETLMAKQELPLGAANGYMNTHSKEINVSILQDQKIDVIALRAKLHKAMFTIAGQREKKLVGSSLAVILRETEMLSGAFDFDSQSGIAYKIKHLVAKAF